MALNKRKVLEAARKHAQKGAKAKALKEYNKLLKEDPRDAKLLLEVGDAYRRWGQNEEAIAQYGKVAQQYRQDGFDARAVAVFKQMLNLDPKNYSAYVSLSELYQRMGLDSEAAGALQTAADGYHKEGRKTEALELLRQMAALDPTNTTSRLKVAELLRQEGMESEALDEYQAVVAELSNQQDRDQLITVLERILEVKPDQIDALVSLARNFMAAGALDRAEPIAIRALNVSAEPEQFELLVDLYAQMGDEAKLADATRGLAKLYRDRGDEDKARELMQRLPVEDVGSSSRLAVDVSEVDEPTIDDNELIAEDEPFLTLGGETEESQDLGLELGEEMLDLGGSIEDPSFLSEAPAAEPEPEPAAEEPLPLPEGDPDQLLAEASVYLRYGKRDQAIASLRGVLAQEPNHRPALEKLGEAYVDNDQSSEAVQVWMQAAEIVRTDGDAQALEVLKDRIAALDPAMAEQIGPVEPGAAVADAADSGHDFPDASAPELDLDLDVGVDLDLDQAIDDVAANVTQGGLDFGSDTDDFEIELDDDAMSFDSAADSSPAPAASIDQDLGSASEDEFEFEVDPNELSVDPAEPDLVVDDELVEEIAADAAAGKGFDPEQSASLSMRMNDELEEAEFYIAQEMYDEAEGILRRLLEQVPNHAGALLRMGEVAAARGGEVENSNEGASEGAAANLDLEITSELDDAVAADAAESSDASPTHDSDDDSVFEIDIDFDDDDDEDAVEGSDEASSEASASDQPTVEDIAVEVAVESEEDQAAPAFEEESAGIEVEATLDTGAETETQGFEPESESEPEPERAAVEVDEPDVAEPLAAAGDEDAGATFDLREALADVLVEDEAPSTDPKEVSGVLSTVEDGFGSIFSDFKKGVTETLDEGDYDTRYDLGIAYREMGLYEDAIGEFRFCLESPTRRFDSLYLMGLCARDLSRFDDAINHLEQALAMPDLPEDRLAGVYFDLSVAEEGSGNRERACSSVQRVLEIDPDFPGAADRLAMLESDAPTSPELGEPGEAFESFDELFSDDDDSDDEASGEPEAVESFESFDDLVSEAEAALDDANFVDGADDDTQGEALPEATVEPEPAVEPESGTKSQKKPPKKGGKKKISFV